jgi:L-2-hydroxycarboxylate dehydrogenase (NAD+)
MDEGAVRAGSRSEGAGPVRVMPDALSRFVADVFTAAGMTQREAVVTAAVLTDADLRGVHTHGAVRVNDYAAMVERGRWLPGREPTVLRESGAVAVLDGGHGVGPHVAAGAMDHAVSLAAEHGAGWVWLRNGGHFGACAYYSSRAAERGMVGFTFTSSSPAMAPWGGTDAVLGSNPWSIAVPRGDGEWPIVLDIANTVTARGRVKAALMREQPLQEGWARDATGRPTTDPAQALGGSMEPFGGHKGYAIAFVIAALTGALSGSAVGAEIRPPFGDAEGPQGVGQLFGALNVPAVIDASDSRPRVDRLCDQMHAGGPSVVVPGEPEGRLKADQSRHGIVLPSHVWASIEEAARRHSLSPPVAG